MPIRTITLTALLLLVAAAGFGDTWEGVERVVAIGDIHGDYPKLIEVLSYADLIDAKKKWTGGKAHLVLLGDVPDRGPDTRKILDFLMDLEKQAKKAGGMVHALIGNHEAMNVYGDLRYTTAEEFAAFKSPDSAQLRSQYYDAYVEEQRKYGQPVSDTAVARAAFEKQYPLGYFEHRRELAPAGRYGKWIVSRNAVVRINDTLFLHGGISPKYAGFTREQMNKIIVSELKDWTKLSGGVTSDPEGPLWYRGLASADPSELAGHVDAVLQHHGVKRIVVGHTPTAGAVLPRFGGKVILADVGLTSAYGGRSGCVVIQGGQVSALHRGKRLALPTSDAELPGYLQQAAALDPNPSPLLPLITKLETTSGGTVLK
jgi:hypothetical protein